jgi:small subunit ribosomal protein S1
MSDNGNHWLSEAYNYKPPQRGEIREGILLELHEQGAVIDVGLKHDGFVPAEDIEKLDKDLLAALEPGQEVSIQILRADDREGRLIVSLAYAQKEGDWQGAQALFERDEIWQGEVVDYNRGGLLVKYGQLRAFVPTSHLQRSGGSGRETGLKQYLGRQMPLKFIELDKQNNRLVASERQASKQSREQKLTKLLEQLTEGDVVKGTVTYLTDYGAFVDLDGADGLIHISELSWGHIKHPNELLQVGDEVEAAVQSLDHKRKRIGLSLKQLQPHPWSAATGSYQVDQLVSGVVTNVVDFGVFVVLESGVEGLIHLSELADPSPHQPHDFAQPGDKVVVRILSIDPSRQRIGLSLKNIDSAGAENI